MTKEDFYIIRNSITMRRVAEYYGLRLDSKGFIRCPFHGNGTERTPSLQVYEGYRGFYCRGCGTGGDVIKFVELYEGISSKDAVKVLADRFGVQISDNGDVDPSIRLKAQQAEFNRQQQLIHQQQIQAKLNRLGTLIYGYNHLLDSKDIEMDIETKCYLRGEIPRMEWQWDELFAELRK